VHRHGLGMGKMFIGSQAVRSGQLTAYQLRTDSVDPQGLAPTLCQCRYLQF